MKEIGSLWRTCRLLYFCPKVTYNPLVGLLCGSIVVVAGEEYYGIGHVRLPVVCVHGLGFVSYASQNSLEEYETWMRRREIILRGLGLLEK